MMFGSGAGRADTGFRQPVLEEPALCSVVGRRDLSRIAWEKKSN